MIFAQIPLYRFLKFSEELDIEKTILDCGAGGNQPPLSLFASYGYETTGIEIDEKQRLKAEDFGTQQGQRLGIISGDMTKLEFKDGQFGCVYSYNSIFHMRKYQIEVSLKEMKRVLKPGGLMFVNFLTVDDFRCGEGPCLGNHEYEQMDDEPVIHSYFEHNEADQYFSDMELLYKEVRVLERIYEGKLIRQGFVDYILRKQD